MDQEQETREGWGTGIAKLLTAWACLIKKIKPNLLIVLVLAYAAIVGLFFGLVANSVEATEAFGLIATPLVALIGGTLAVAKDLLQ